MHAVYLIQNDVTKELYFGYTRNLEERLQQHNGNGKKFTIKKSGMWHYIYVEIYRSKSDAMAREAQLKRHANGKQ